VEKNTLTILNHIHDGVYFIDHECKIFFWNRAAECITGYSESDVKDMTCSDNILNPVDDSGKSLCDEIPPGGYQKISNPIWRTLCRCR